MLNKLTGIIKAFFTIERILFDIRQLEEDVLNLEGEMSRNFDILRSDVDGVLKQVKTLGCYKGRRK